MAEPTEPESLEETQARLAAVGDPSPELEVPRPDPYAPVPDPPTRRAPGPRCRGARAGARTRDRRGRSRRPCCSAAIPRPTRRSGPPTRRSRAPTPTTSWTNRRSKPPSSRPICCSPSTATSLTDALGLAVEPDPRPVHQPDAERVRGRVHALVPLDRGLGGIGHDERSGGAPDRARSIHRDLRQP